METQNKPFLHQPLGRILIIAGIIFILLLPLVRVLFLIDERKARAEGTGRNIGMEWGDEIHLEGIVALVPLKDQPNEFRIFYPKSSDNQLKVDVQIKERNIFETPVLTSLLNTQSTFDLPLSDETLDWSKVQTGVPISLNNKIQSVAPFTINSSDYSTTIQTITCDNQTFHFIASSPFTVQQNNLNARTKIAVNGTKSVRMKQRGEHFQLALQSNWKHPSFGGTLSPLPNKTKVSTTGFKASYSNTIIANQAKTPHKTLNDNALFKTGEIRFIQPINHYSLTERTAKYGALVLVLTFAVFFLIELVGKLTIHPLHYTMLGMLLVLFYLLLLSASEQIGFLKAYLLAGLAVVAVSFWYARSVLKSGKFAMATSGSLTLVYGFILIIVHLENLALLAGSLGLFAVLVAIMSVTRKLELKS